MQIRKNGQVGYPDAHISVIIQCIPLINGNMNGDHHEILNETIMQISLIISYFFPACDSPNKGSIFESSFSGVTPTFHCIPVLSLGRFSR